MKISDGELADKLMHLLADDMRRKAESFDYLCWLEETQQRDGVKDAPFILMASDGTTCWGKKFGECVCRAMEHDRELYDAVRDNELYD